MPEVPALPLLSPTFGDGLYSSSGESSSGGSDAATSSGGGAECGLSLKNAPEPSGLLSNKGNLWKVGSYRELRGLEAGLYAHHVGQKSLMKEFAPSYNFNTAPSILVPEVGHTIRGVNGIVSRSTRGITNARNLLDRDISELRRVFSSQGLPNTSLQELIKMNKTMYPNSFTKKPL